MRGRHADLWKFPLFWTAALALAALTYAVSLLIGATLAIVFVWGGATLIGWIVERYFWPD